MASPFLLFSTPLETEIIDAVKNIKGYSTGVSEALNKDPAFNSDEFIQQLSQKEVSFWLGITVKEICDSTSGLNYKRTFETVINSETLTPEGKIKQVSEIFENIINDQNIDQTTKDQIITRIGLVSKDFEERSTAHRWEQKKSIGKAIACTIIAVFIVTNTVSALMSLTSQLVTLATIGLGGYYAANKLAPDQTAHALDAVNNSGILGTISKGISITGSAIKNSGFPEKLSAATLACMNHVTLNPFTMNRLYQEHQKLTGAILGVQRLVDLANKYKPEKDNKSSPKKP